MYKDLRKTQIYFLKVNDFGRGGIFTRFRLIEESEISIKKLDNSR